MWYSVSDIKNVIGYESFSQHNQCEIWIGRNSFPLCPSPMEILKIQKQQFLIRLRAQKMQQYAISTWIILNSRGVDLNKRTETAQIYSLL